VIPASVRVLVCLEPSLIASRSASSLFAGTSVNRAAAGNTDSSVHSKIFPVTFRDESSGDTE
jgi:hypothetical protein